MDVTGFSLIMYVRHELLVETASRAGGPFGWFCGDIGTREAKKMEKKFGASLSRGERSKKFFVSDFAQNHFSGVFDHGEFISEGCERKNL